MTSDVRLQLGIVFGSFFIIWICIKLIAYLKNRDNNTALWGTIFEGLTHKVVDLDPLKEPETRIEKKSEKDGQDKDPLKAK